MNLMNRIDTDELALGFMQPQIVNPNDKSPSYLTFGTRKLEPNLTDLNTSDDEEPNSSKWQRMKWSDNRVRLLIQVVANEDIALDSGLGTKSSAFLQKKGKWKSVSKIMESKGCQVSPQQCEDKFNDLNKRYKRLNDMLGREVSCRVVENPSLIDSMTRVSGKTKEDVKKILNSKHLFYAEMCAYHSGQRIPNCAEFDGLKVTHEEEDDDDDDDNDDDDYEDLNDGKCEWENVRKRFFDEMNEFFEDSRNSKAQKKEWVKKRTLQLLEQRIGIENEGFEMEKRRVKWQRFCDRKDRELEVSKLENERLVLENQRMALQLKYTDRVVVVDSD